MYDDRYYDHNRVVIRRTYLIFALWLLITAIAWVVVLCGFRKEVNDLYKDKELIPLICLLIAIGAILLMIVLHGLITNILFAIIAFIALFLASLDCILMASKLYGLIAIIITIVLFALVCVTGHYCTTDFTLAIIHILIILALCMIGCFCYIGIHHLKSNDLSVIAIVFIAATILLTLLVVIMFAQTIAGRSYIRTCPEAFVISATFLYILYVVFLILFIHFLLALLDLIHKDKNRGNKLELPPHSS